MEILLLCLLVCLFIYLFTYFSLVSQPKKILITKTKLLAEKNHRVVRDYRDHKLQPQPVHFFCNNEYMINKLMVYAKQCYLN